MYNFLMSLIFVAIYLLGIQVNKYLFITKLYKNHLKEGMSKEDAYENAKFRVESELRWILPSLLSWVTTAILLLFKVLDSYINYIEKKMKKFITK